MTSTQGSAAAGMSVTDVRAAAREFLRLYRFPVKVQVFERQEDFLGEQATQQNEGRIVGAIYRTTATVKLAAASLIDRADVHRTLRHEVLGHWGSLCLAKEDKRDLLDKLKAVRHRPGGLGDLWRRVERDWPPPRPVALMSKTQREHFDDVLAEEVFASAAEAPRPSRLGSAWIQIKATAVRGLRKAGFIDAEIRIEEVNALIDSLARGMRRGALQLRIFPEHDGAMFSRSEERVFMSGLTAAFESARGAPREAPASRWIEWLDGAQRRGEIKQAERAWSGVDEWLGAQPGTVRREQLVEYVRANEIEIGEVVFGNEVVPSDLSAEEEVELTDLYLRERSDPEGLTEAEAQRLGALEDRARRVVSWGPETKYDEWQLPGGQGYRELALTLLDRRSDALQAVIANGERVCVRGEWLDWQQAAERFLEPAHASGFRKTIDKFGPGMRTTLVEDVLVPEIRVAIGALKPAASVFTESHLAADNVIAHVRFNERRTLDGRRALHVEEIQSDWSQLGRARGFERQGQRAELERERETLDAQIAATVESTEDKAALIARRAEVMGALEQEPVPDTPFKRTEDWVLLAVKRVVRWAAERGFDCVTFTTGAMQEERYDLSRRVDRINVVRTGDLYRFAAYKNDQSVEVLAGVDLTASELPGVIGKDLAEKAVHDLRGGDGQCNYSGFDLRVGGDGMRAFYDTLVPKAVNAWARRLGGALTTTKVPAEAAALNGVACGEFEAKYTELSDRAQQTVRAIAAENVQRSALEVRCLGITDTMRSAVMQAMPMFRREAPPAGWRVVFRTDTAAFDDVGREAEIAQVLRQAAGAIERARPSALRDTNGAEIGRVEPAVALGPRPGPGEIELLVSVPAARAREAAAAVEGAASALASGARSLPLVATDGTQYGMATQAVTRRRALERGCQLEAGGEPVAPI